MMHHVLMVVTFVVDPPVGGHHIRQSSDISPISGQRPRVKTNGHFTPHLRSTETATQTTPKSLSLSNVHSGKCSSLICIYTCTENTELAF